MSLRLNLALSEGGLLIPEDGQIAVLHPGSDVDLYCLPKDRVTIVQPYFADYKHFERTGFAVATSPNQLTGPVSATIVFLPRAKAQARALIASAMEISTDLVVIDGAKTDGVDSIYKELRRRCAPSQPLSKAHGKLFWLRPDPGLADDWTPAETRQIENFVTAPGVFSADGIDPASALLANVLPAKLGRHVVDLGAGWGFLSARLLQGGQLQTLDLIEADHVALECARKNILDPRARFHWDDARTWSPDERIDTVVCNPPFHSGRKVDAELGRDFIRSAARILTNSGQLWMVANRHLAYETVLKESFAEVSEAAGDNRFKVLHAKRPSRSQR